MASQCAVARPFRAWGSTGFGLPYASPKSPTSWWRPFADLSESEHHMWCSDSEKAGVTKEERGGAAVGSGHGVEVTATGEHRKRLVGVLGVTRGGVVAGGVG